MIAQKSGLWDLAAASGVNEVAVHDPGSLLLASRLGIKAGAGYGFNLVNSRAVEQVKAWGAVWASPSLEISRDNLRDMASRTPLPLEVVVHGPLCGMITDYCPVGLVDAGDAESCSSPCERETCRLVDSLGQKYPLECDEQCRCYIYHPDFLCLPNYRGWPADIFGRIEGMLSAGTPGPGYRHIPVCLPDISRGSGINSKFLPS